jgi:hypothetical protein
MNRTRKTVYGWWSNEATLKAAKLTLLEELVDSRLPNPHDAELAKFFLNGHKRGWFGIDGTYVGALLDTRWIRPPDIE